MKITCGDNEYSTQLDENCGFSYEITPTSTGEYYMMTIVDENSDFGQINDTKYVLVINEKVAHLYVNLESYYVDDGDSYYKRLHV